MPSTSFTLMSGLVVLASCSGPSAEECAHKLDALQAKLDVLERDAWPDALGERARSAPLANASRPLEMPGALLDVSEHGVLLDGRTLGSLGDDATHDALRRELDTLHRNWELLHPTHAAAIPIYFSVTGQLRAERLMRLVSALPEHNEPRLVVRSAVRPLPSPLAPGASADLARKVARIENSEPVARSPLFMALLDEARGRCTALRDLLDHVTHEQNDKTMLLRAGVIPAARKCGCRDMQVDALEAWVVLVLSPSEPPTGWLPLYGVLPRIYAVGASVSELATKLAAAERLTEHLP